MLSGFNWVKLLRKINMQHFYPLTDISINDDIALHNSAHFESACNERHRVAMRSDTDEN